MSDEIEIFKARLQLFERTLPGDKRIAQQIHEEGVIATRDQLATHTSLRDAEAIHQEILGASARFITPEMVSWPSGFSDLLAPPIGITVRGLLPEAESIAIVGTRNPSHYGLSVTRSLTAGLIDHGFVIVSGGALGIDTEVHRSALNAEGITIAIIGSGLKIDYPASNRRLFEEITERGAVISEVMPEVTARPERFLTRNRLIAAISRSTIVIEAAFRSGSLRTARDAAELLRPVMAVPGPITSPTSEGCHRLIADRTAEIVTSLSDVVEMLSPL
jgi:DNA processing protein